MSLSKLIEAVEAGTLQEQPYGGMPMATACYPRDEKGRMTADTGGWSDADCLAAYHGSLDAAKRLHDALLPGWTVDNMGDRAGGWLAQLGRFDGKTPRPAPEAMIRDNPARAWLLCILRALEQEGDHANPR